ncbi:22.3 kDa class VI heat shock protein-like [Ananas comosus]|uniref:22.3 kDa class VI heat shock protein-like n=1 Tax=Ananas comosus TaxID=4615 RepID=A0A6P5FK56_ANACO|nr:22.3 kDa class VI heat shock protein-like [Ananas comosus]
MPRRTAIDVRQPSDQTSNRQKWRVSLTEDAFESFMARCGDAGREVFGEGSLFSPMLFGKFFDPSDAFPLWEFDSDDLLSALRCSSKTSVDWAESSSEFILRAHVPGARKCEVEICGEKPKVVMEISGQWGPAVREPGPRDWRSGRWWERGFVRRIELPENANWRRAEAYITEDEEHSLLEIKIPKNNNNFDSNTHHTSGGGGGEGKE